MYQTKPPQHENTWNFPAQTQNNIPHVRRYILPYMIPSVLSAVPTTCLHFMYIPPNILKWVRYM